MHEWGFKQYRKRPTQSQGVKGKAKRKRESQSQGTVNSNPNGNGIQSDTQQTHERRDVRAVDKYVELALVLDQAMVWIMSSDNLVQ